MRPGLGNGIFSLTWWVPTHVLNCEFLLYLLTALSFLPCYPFQQLGSCVCDLEQACQLANWAIHYVNCRAPWKFAISITCRSCEIRHLPAWAFRTPLSFFISEVISSIAIPFHCLTFSAMRSSPWTLFVMASHIVRESDSFNTCQVYVGTCNKLFVVCLVHRRWFHLWTHVIVLTHIRCMEA